MEYLASDDFDKSSNLYFFVWFVFGCTILRYKYYLAFTITELTVDLCGISWNAKKKDMSSYRNFDFWGVEWDQSSFARIKAWNTSIAQWLNSIIYNRCWYKKSIDVEIWKLKFVIPFNKSLAALSVFAFSSLWHGFYLSYYHIFLSWFMFRELQLAAYNNRDVLMKLPTWPLPKFITGSNNDYAYIKDVQQKLEEKIPFFPKYRWNWLPLRFDPWMIITQITFFVWVQFCSPAVLNLHHLDFWLCLKRTYFMSFTLPVVVLIFPYFCKQVKIFYDEKENKAK